MPEGPPAGRARARRSWPSRPVLLEGGFVVALVLVASVFLLVVAHRMWFFGDDWAFVLGRHDSLRGRGGFLEPHNEHWSTVPLVAFRLVHLVFGTSHYLPYALLPVLAHAVTCAGLFVLLRRSGILVVPAGLATAVLAFYGGGAEDTLWAFQVGFLATAAFVVLALLVDSFPLPTPARLVVVTLLLLLATMSSGMAIPLVGWAGLSVLFRRGWRSALAVVALPAVAYAGWRLLVESDISHSAPKAPVGLILPFAGKGLEAIWSAETAMAGAGAPILIGLLVVSIAVGSAPEARALAMSGMVACVGLFLTLGVSRAGLGLDGAASSRYLYMGMLLTVPAFAVALQRLWVAMPWRSLPAAVVWVLVAVFLLACGTTKTIDFSEDRGRTIDEAGVRLAAGGVLARHEQTLTDMPDPLTSPDVRLADLRRPGIRDYLRRVHLDSYDVLTARSLMQVGVTSRRPSSAYSPSPSVVARDATGVRPLTGQPGCFAGYAAPGTALNFRGGSPGYWVELTTAATVVATGVATDSRATDVRTVGVTPDEPVWVVSAAPGYRTRVLLQPGRFTYCQSPTTR